MALLQKKLVNPRALVAMVNLRRMMAHDVASPKPWNYLWKPGPYPRTEEDRVKAAKKVRRLTFVTGLGIWSTWQTFDLPLGDRT